MESQKDLVKKGKKLYEEGNIEEAIGYYDKAISRDPEYFEAWVHKAEVLTKKGELENAVECYDRAIKIKGKGRPGLLMEKGDILRKLGKFNEALESYNSIPVWDIVKEIIISGVLMIIVCGIFSRVADMLPLSYPPAAVVAFPFMCVALSSIGWFIFSIYQGSRFFFRKRNLKKRVRMYNSRH